jgi:hypothetical protein
VPAFRSSAAKAKAKPFEDDGYLSVKVLSLDAGPGEHATVSLPKTPHHGRQCPKTCSKA